jgi:phytol kinase
VGYLSWALGDWRWLLVPLIVFVAYKVLGPRVLPQDEPHHNIHAVICVCAAGLIWLFSYSLLERHEFYYLFTLAFAAQMAMIAVVQLGCAYPQLSGPALLSVCVLKGWALLFVPWVLIEWSSPRCLLCALWAVPGIALAAIGFYLTQPQVRNCPADTPRWLRQAAHGGLGSAVGLLPLYVL